MGTRAPGPGERGEVAAVNRGWAGMALGSYIGGAAAVNRGGRAIHRKRGGNRLLVLGIEAPG